MAAVLSDDNKLKTCSSADIEDNEEINDELVPQNGDNIRKKKNKKKKKKPKTNEESIDKDMDALTIDDQKSNGKQTNTEDIDGNIDGNEEEDELKESTNQKKKKKKNKAKSAANQSSNCVSSGSAKSQTNPPSIPITQLFPDGSFPIGQEVEHPIPRDRYVF